MGTMSLFCGHTYHRFCILEWRRVSRRGELECPLRCTPDSVAARRTLGFVFINHMSIGIGTICFVNSVLLHLAAL